MTNLFVGRTRNILLRVQVQIIPLQRMLKQNIAHVTYKRDVRLFSHVIYAMRTRSLFNKDVQFDFIAHLRAGLSMIYELVWTARWDEGGCVFYRYNETNVFLC
jgi:hypothetical protein